MIVDTAWVRRYSGPANGDDGARAIAVDDSGNVYVTGASYGGETGSDYATIKYCPNGDTAWIRRYNGPGNDEDRAYAIAVDNFGNAYVTGQSTGSGTDYDYATIKYLSDGDTAWVRRYNGSGNHWDMANAITVDDSGYVYVTGYSHGSGTFWDYATMKYYPNGDTAWVRKYNGPANLDDAAISISVDHAGNVYVTGWSYESATYSDYATIKYDSNGDTAWVRRYDGAANSYDFAFAIAVDESGNVYVTGLSHSGTAYEYATIKYDSNGDTVWVRRYTGPGTYLDATPALAVDNSGNACVTGYTRGSGAQEDYLTIKYHSNGDTAWVREYNEPGQDIARALAVDDSNNVYVTGYSVGSGTSLDNATIKYNSDGNQLWVERYNGPTNGPDGSLGVAVDASGNVCVTGHSWGGYHEYYDYTTIKYVHFLRGDADGDGTVDAEDLVYLIHYLYINGPPPVPILQVVDVNCDGVIDLGDILYLIAYLYKGGPAPDCS